MSNITEFDEPIGGYPTPPGSNGDFNEWVAFMYSLFKFTPNGWPGEVAELIEDLMSDLGWTHNVQFKVVRYFSAVVMRWPTKLMLLDGKATNILPTTEERKNDLNRAIMRLMETHSPGDIGNVKGHMGEFQKWEKDKRFWIYSLACVPDPSYAFQAEIKVNHRFWMHNGSSDYANCIMNPGFKVLVRMNKNKTFRMRLFYHAEHVSEGDDIEQNFSICCIPQVRFLFSVRVNEQVVAPTERVEAKIHSFDGGQVEVSWSEDYTQINYSVKFNAHNYDQVSTQSNALCAGESHEDPGDQYVELVDVTEGWSVGWGQAPEDNPYYFDFSSAFNYYRKRVKLSIET